MFDLTNLNVSKVHWFKKITNKTQALIFKKKKVLQIRHQLEILN